MLVATSNKSTQLLVLTYVGHVTLKELVDTRENLKTLLAEMTRGFRILADYTHMDQMDPDCLAEIGRVMEAMDKVGVGTIVRVMPDAKKDLGINIMTNFHYHHRPKVITCENFGEAARALSL